MTRIDSFDIRETLIRKHFENYKQDTKKPEHSAVCELYRLYDDSMTWFYTEERSEGPELEQWREQLNIAGIKAHKIYTRLKEKGVNVEYCKHLLKNREESCNSGPDKLEFHLHHNVVEDLLNFCIIGTTDTKELSKMRKALELTIKN